MKEINYICSLGDRCCSAYWIKQMKLKKCSYPFDWIFSNIDMIIDCINNNFNIFLNRKLHLPGKDEYSSNHKIYIGPWKNADIFNHHNILNDTHYNYFVRCVDRFKKLLEKDNNKLFIISFINKKNNISCELKNKIMKLYDILLKNTNNFDLLVVYHMLGNKFNTNIENINTKIKIFNVTTTALSNGCYIQDKNENRMYNNLIFKLYNFKILDL